MEKSVGICEEDVLEQERDLHLEDDEELEEEMEEMEKGETVAAESFGNRIQTSYRFKITEILKNLHSSELVTYSNASKDFISLLRGEFGGSVLSEYVQLSPKCAEILEAWKLHLGKPGMSFILSLVSVILSHPDGKSQPVSIRISLDSVARSIFDDKLDDIYAELNSQESRRQSAALSLLGSIVRRRMGLASEVAKKFDFKLAAFSKLSGIQKKKAGKDFKHVVRPVTRKAFVEFAMSFLEVGNPRLLRWILQQREMYSGVLRGLANDDSDTIILVLSTLRDKVLIESSLVPPGLRSVLFGSATLEQLSYISANQMAGVASDIAHEVLVMVCTDPQNGLMPGLGLKGNKKRLLDLMRKLKATEVEHHKQLLLSIVKGKANLCSSYMDEFPYCLEPRPSSSWFSAISLAADLVSTLDTGASISTISSHLCDQPVAEIDELHAILKCIIPRTFTRSVINKGLLHSDILVKHGSLRLIFESLKSLDSLITSVDRIVESTVMRQEADFRKESVVSFHNLPSLEFLVHAEKDLNDGEFASTRSNKVETLNWVALKHYVQNEIRAELPDPQVLLKLLSSSSTKYSGIGVKRSANFPNSGMKKMKSDKASENIDIVIGGLDMLPINTAVEDSTIEIVGSSNQNSEMESHFSLVYDIWGLIEKTTLGNKPKDADYFFQSKLLDVLKFYLRALPIAFEGSFDFFKILPSNPSSLSFNQQQSLLSLLVEYIRQPSGNQVSAEVPESMFKHLHPLINFLIFSHVKDIQSQAYTLVRAAMISTGAFDQNLSEIDAWFVFLPGYIKNNHIDQSNEVDSLCNEAAVVISFLCEAVSTIGNNLYKYLSQLRKLLPDHSPCCSPLVVCVLQKCLRLIESDSGTFKLYEKSLISLYVGNTLSLIMQSQVDMRTLPCIIYKLLCEFFKGHSSAEDDSKNFQCEWRPLKNLFCFACNIMNQKLCILQSVSGYASRRTENPFSSVLDKVKELLRQAQGERVDNIASSFSSSILCTAPDDILANFPSVLAILQLYFPSHLPFLCSIFFQEQRLLVRIRELWSKMFFFGLEMINQSVNHSYGGEVGYLLSSNASILETNCDFPEFSGSAFCSFLKHSSFYALFSAILSFVTWDSHLARIEEVFPSTTILEFLKVKILEVSVDDSILHLKYVLFWTYHMFLMHKVKQSFIINELLQMCITLVQDIMDHILEVIFNQAGLKAAGLSSAGQYAQVIIELTFSHPIVTLYISNPLYFSREITDDACGNSINSFLTNLKQNIHPMDHCTLQLLRKLLSVLSCALSSLKTDNSACKTFLRVQNILIQKILLPFREKFEQFVVSKNPGPFLPIFYMFHSLMEFISPFIMLELVHWIFSTIEGNISGGTSSLDLAVSVGMYIADASLDKMYCFLRSSTLNLDSDFYLDGGIKRFDASLVPKIFYMILDLTLSFNLEQGDLCLLKAVNELYNLQHVKPLTALLPLHVLLSSMIFNIPVKLLAYCIHPTSKIKAKTLMLLTEVSPVHMNLFGTLFLTILNNSPFNVDSSNAGCMLLSKCKNTSNSKVCFLNDDFLLLLPVALSFFSFTFVKHGNQGIQHLKKIPLTYGAILLDGFSNWNTFVSREIFQEDYDDFSPVSLEEFNKFYCRSLIGKAIAMLSYFFVSNRSSIRLKKRLKLFDSICPQLSFFDEQFSIGAEGMDSCSYKDSLKLVNQIAAKISFIRLLFSSECSIPSMVFSEEESVKDMFTAKESRRLDHAKLKFMNILVNTLDQIFKQFPLKVNSSVTGATHCYRVFRFLEHLILKEIVWLSNEIRCFLIEFSYFTLLNNFIRSSLLHRFEDPVTLKAIRCILVALSGSKFSFSDVLEHLIGHSVFVKIISLNLDILDSSVSTSSGTLLQPINSVLKLVDVSFSLQNVQQNVSHDERSSKMRCDDYFVEDAKLELVRLLRILFLQIDRNTIMGSFNSKELLSLLLCGYSATQSQIDLEIFHLIHEIELLEGPDNGSLEALDYIWGVAALKIRKEKVHDVLLPVNMTSDCETIEERKILFRENIPIDSKVCAVTVLHLCNDRSSRVSASLESILKDTFINYPEIIENFKKDTIQPYDPSFILRFSSHSLSMGYLEPAEFSRLGLLAVTFSSISSSDENLRKLGYECLGRFKISLESCRKSKDLLQLQLLLTFLQNGITEECQKIPSIIAIFAAEASLTLLDHSHNYFLSINKFLMSFPRVDLKAVPMFQTFLGSSSMQFRTDSFWILRLLYAGLNSPIDAKLYLNNNILGVLLSYSASSLVDDEFKILTLMVVKKSVQIQILADQLVKEFGLIPWLSSLLLFYGERLVGHQEQSFVNVVKLILEVVKDVISSSMIIEWLHDRGLEQLSEFSLLLVKLLVGAVKLLKEDVLLVNAMLIVITSTVKLSQKRKIHQPHFTISLECLIQLFQAISIEFGSSEQTIELGMNFILMNTPIPVTSHEHKARLMQLLTWAAPASLWLTSTKKSLIKDLNTDLTILSNEDQGEESFASKLLRWVSASIILGTVLRNRSEICSSSRKSGNENMLSYLKGISIDVCDVPKDSPVLDESLALLILHLQGFLCTKFVLPTILSALYVLLLGSASSRTGTVKEYLDDNHEKIQSLCAKIPFPAEAKPSWRWSFDLPANDSSKSETELMAEERVCQSLLAVFSNAVSVVKSHGFSAPSFEDAVNYGLFQ